MTHRHIRPRIRLEFGNCAMHLFSTSKFIPGQAISRTIYEARGTIVELRMTSSRVSKGTLCTTLVAAMKSSAGSLRKSKRVEARATVRSIGHT